MNERPPARVLFAYWGRRGALALFTLRLAEAAQRRSDIKADLVLSSYNELREEYVSAGLAPHFLPLFRTGPGALLGLARLPWLRARLAGALKALDAAWLVELMPHVWSPFFEATPRRLGVRRAVIVHDAEPHPGDASGVVTSWLLASARRADHIFTLSRHVSEAFLQRFPDCAGRVTQLMHPSLDVAQTGAVRTDGPLRVLFFGRILPYKGLDMLLDALSRARKAGVDAQLGVFGEGELGATRAGLAELGAEVCNRWIAHGELADILARHDLMALPYREASQSGAAALALSAGMPVLATPVGGLPEQIAHEQAGLVARAPTADALGECIIRLAQDRALFSRLADGARAAGDAASMPAFLDAMLRALFAPAR